MSSAATLLIVGYVIAFGVSEVQKDEGMPARIFQMLLVGQVPLMVYLGIKWFSKMPKHVLFILGLQVAASFFAISLVILFER